MSKMIVPSVSKMIVSPVFGAIDFQVNQVASCIQTNDDLKRYIVKYGPITASINANPIVNVYNNNNNYLFKKYIVRF